MTNRFLIRAYLVSCGLLQKCLNFLLRRQKQPAQIQKILIANYFLFGDTLLLAPLLKVLRQTYPNATIVVLVRPAYAVLFDNAPYGVSPLLFNPREFSSIQQIIQSGPYDLALIPDDNRYALLAQAAKARWIRGFINDTPKWKNFFVNEFVNYANTPTAWAEMQLALLPHHHNAALSVYVPDEWPLLESNNNVRTTQLWQTSQQLSQLPDEYILLHVGASSPLKRWPTAAWQALVQWLEETYHLPIIWSAGRGEEQWVDAIDPMKHYLSLAGKTSMAELVALVKGASLLVSPDTGIAHLGRIANTPTVTLFGPGSSMIHGAGEFWSASPYRSVTVADIACRNQSILFRRQIGWVKRCGRSFGQGPSQCQQAICMNEISLTQVTEAVSLVFTPKPALQRT